MSLRKSYGIAVGWPRGAGRSLGLATPPVSSGGGGGGGVAVSAPFYDTFTTDGLISARPGWTVTTTTAQAGSSGALSTLSGNLRSTIGAAGVSVIGTHDSGGGTGESRAWFKPIETLYQIPATGFLAHPIEDATNGLSGFTHGDQSGVTLNTILNSATGGRAQLVMSTVAGMPREIATVNDAGTMRAKLYVSGRPYDIVADPVAGAPIASLLSRAPNGVYGFTAGIGNPAVRVFSTINPVTDRWIRVVSTAPVRASGVIYLYGEYGGPTGDVAPTNAQITITAYNAATDAVISGYNAVPLSNFAASGGVWSATIDMGTTDNYWIEVKWTFQDALLATVFASYPTQTIKKGYNIWVDGQSQVGFMNAPGETITLPANSWYFQATTAAARGKRILADVTANSHYAWMSNILQGYGAGGFVIVNAALGSNPQSARMPPTAQFTEVVESFQSAGAGRPSICIFAGGTNTEPVNDIYQNIITTANGYEDAVGMARGTMLFGVSPEGSVTGVGQASVNRRLMWQLCRDFPTRFKLIAWRNDIQHGWDGTTLDPLHYMTVGGTGYVAGVTVSQTEWCRRMARGTAKALGLTTDDFLGPRMAGFTRNSTTSFDLTLDSIASFDDTEIANTAYAGDFGGGLIFNTSSGFGAGTAVVPTNCVRQSASVYRYTVPVTAGTLYAKVNDINNPFNAGAVAAIDQLMKDRASMIRGIKTGMVPAGIQPSYDVGGAGTNIDHLSA